MTSLYIHIPFCQQKCFYCSFVVSVGQQHRMDLYLECLAKEAQRYKGTKIESIYIGGGTPTELSNTQFEKLFKILRENFRFSPAPECTVEVNPDGLEMMKAELLRKQGVNRISMGVQSLNDKYLRYLGRSHDRQTAVAGFTLLRKAGFDNINLDLMFSFPGQTRKELEEDVLAITKMRSDHLSLYALDLEKNSRFFEKNIQLPDAERQADYYLFIIELLETAGFKQYEISNFAKPGKESQHNWKYWLGGNYIGLGVGAHSHHNGKRYWNVSKLTEYIHRLEKNFSPMEDWERLKEYDRFLEALLFGLRTNAGVDLATLHQRFHYRLDQQRKETIRQFMHEGFLIQESKRLTTTLKGRLVLDDIIGIFDSQKNIGKPILSDLTESKKTLLVCHAYKQLNGQKKKLFAKHFNKSKKTYQDLITIRKIFINSGSLGYSLQEIAVRVHKTLKILRNLKMKEPYKQVIARAILQLFQQSRHIAKQNRIDVQIAHS